MTIQTEVAIDPRDARALVRAAFPKYRGRKVRVVERHAPVDVRSYWDEGSRRYFVAVHRDGRISPEVPQNGTPFDGGPIAPDGVTIPPGCAIVELLRSGYGDRATIYLGPGQRALPGRALRGGAR